MNTPMQEMFHRLEQVRFATDPVSEMFKLQEVMLEKEKAVMLGFADDVALEALSNNSLCNAAERVFQLTFNTEEK